MAPSQRTGLTLTLPPLKGGKLAKKPQPIPEKPKISRSVKLKPLKEVLARLIAQIRRKDDYAFFLEPVDVERVSGYSDVVKHPMDLGTMQSKVMANCYRSLEEFTTDFRLVISNATSFNPPETLYHTEALRISAFGLEQISRASATVIQYETDWTIEVVEDDIQPPLQMDQGPNARPGAGRSPSVQPQPTGLGRRGLRGTQSKRISTAPSNAKAETGVPQDQIIDGRLPGSFDGVGAFPPGCAWAKMIVELKIKGKRYKSKRERLRIEKEGPPYHLDGSLDYCALENPFTILSSLVPDRPKKPFLIPLSTTPPIPSRQSSLRPIPSSTAQVTSTATSSIALQASYSTFSLGTYPRVPAKETTAEPSPTPTQTFPPDSILHPVPLGSSRKRPFSSAFSSSSIPESTNVKRKHWTIASNVRAFKKEAVPEDKDGEELDVDQGREAVSDDWGCFPLTSDTDQSWMSGGGYPHDHDEVVGVDWNPEAYWTPQRAEDGERFVREAVYGGWSGLAVVRSMAEFCTPSGEQRHGFGLESSHGHLGEAKSEPRGAGGLGMPLADYVRTRVIGPLTGGMHELLYQAGLSLSFGDPGPSIAASSQAHTFLKDDVSDRVKITESIHPALSHLLGVLKQQIDMACLIRRPDEIYESEKAWVGGAGRAARLPGGQTHQERGGLDGDEKEEEDERGEVTLGHEADKLPAVNGHPVGDKLHAAEDDPTNAIAEPLGSAPDAITAEDPRAVAEPNESQEVLQGVLDYVARAILEFDQRIRDGKTLDVKGGGERHGSAFESNVKSEGEPTAQDFEDPMLKMIRLNLLALSKRAPLDKIARLPKELVPVHIRQFVPTT